MLDKKTCRLDTYEYFKEAFKDQIGLVCACVAWAWFQKVHRGFRDPKCVSNSDIHAM